MYSLLYTARITWLCAKIGVTAAVASLFVMNPAGAAEPSVSADSRDIVLDYSWGYNTGLKQPEGSFKDGRSVHAVSRFTRPNPKPNLPPGDADLGSPDFLVWVDETTGEVGALEHPAGVLEDGVNPGGNVVFSSDSAPAEKGRLWWTLGGRANELPLDIARSTNLFDPHHFDIVLNDFETVERSTSPTLSVVGQTGLLVYRYLNSTNPNAAVLFNRYDLSSGIPSLQSSTQIGLSSHVSDLGDITIEQVWSRWDPRRGALAVSWQWFARQGSGSQQTKYFGSNPFIYTDDFGATWRLVDGTPVTLPLSYATTTDPKVSPYDHLAMRQSAEWFTRDVGFAPDGTPWIVLPAGSQRSMQFFFWTAPAWQQRTLSTDLETGDPFGCGATRDYLVCAYSETQRPGQLQFRFSADNGQTWSAPVVVDTVGTTPEGTLQRIDWVSFVQPVDGYPDNAARFFVGYYRTADGSRGRNFKNNIRWVHVALGSDPVSYTLAPEALAFGDQAVNLTSSAATIVLSNTASASLPITSIAISGGTPAQFSLSHDCGASVAGGSTCTISVTFKPTSTGPKTANITVTAGSGQGIRSVALSGTGVQAAAYSVTPSALKFGNVVRNTISSAQSFTISNTGTVVLPIKSITIGGVNPGQFARTSSCPAGVPVGGGCSVSVVFKPTSTGNKSANLTVTPGNGIAAKSAVLTGTGTWR